MGLDRLDSEPSGNSPVELGVCPPSRAEIIRCNSLVAGSDGGRDGAWGQSPRVGAQGDRTHSCHGVDATPVLRDTRVGDRKRGFSSLQGDRRDLEIELSGQGP